VKAGGKSEGEGDESGGSEWDGIDD